MPSRSRNAEQRARLLRADAELLASADPEAFGIFYDRHIGVVLRYFFHRTACTHTAADLAAETFFEALRHRDRYDETRGQPRAWLFGIARNRFRRFARKGATDAAMLRRLAIPAVWDEQDLRRVEDLVDSAELRAEVAASLALLTPTLRAAVELRVLEGLPYAEVAEQLGCTEGAARVRVSRALGMLADGPVRTHSDRGTAGWTPT